MASEALITWAAITLTSRRLTRTPARAKPQPQPQTSAIPFRLVDVEQGVVSAAVPGQQVGRSLANALDPGPIGLHDPEGLKGVTCCVDAAAGQHL